MTSLASAVRLAESSTNSSRTGSGSELGWPPRYRPAQSATMTAAHAAAMRPVLLLMGRTRSLHAEEAAQRDTRADHRHTDRGDEQVDDQHQEARGVDVLKQASEAGGERIRHCDLSYPQDQYGDEASRDAHYQPLDHEGPADEPAGCPDQAHHLDFAAAREDRKADCVAD